MRLDRWGYMGYAEPSDVAPLPKQTNDNYANYYIGMHNVTFWLQITTSALGTPDFGGKQPGMGGCGPEGRGGSPEAAIPIRQKSNRWTQHVGYIMKCLCRDNRLWNVGYLMNFKTRRM
jgi:hypothetical protein